MAVLYGEGLPIVLVSLQVHQPNLEIGKAKIKNVVRILLTSNECYYSAHYLLPVKSNISESVRSCPAINSLTDFFTTRIFSSRTGNSLKNAVASRSAAAAD